MKYLILTEKIDAAKNFSAALGGMSGFLPDSNDSYDIVAADGHLLELPNPEEMVIDQKNLPKYKNWSDINLFPWNAHDFNWEKKAIYGKQKNIDMIRKCAIGHDAVIVATDYDPSGEGAVLASEILEKIDWNKQVYRIHFADETKDSIRQSLANMTDVTDSTEWGELQKGLARERFDKMSMQLSRIALIVERSANYSVPTQNLGRLKSVIIGLINYQWQQREKYIAKPYYAIHFIDKNNNVFAKKNAEHYESNIIACQAKSKFKSSNIEIIGEEIWDETPPDLLNLSYLSVKLGKQGYSADLVLKTYQKMYLAGYVSYPRTSETTISQADFDRLLPLAPRIAKAINIDPTLLTQAKCRKRFLSDYTNHGANRPGIRVPNSLDEISTKYGSVGEAIYNTLARSYLAILADDYSYRLTKACLTDYPDYNGSFREPINLGYRQILNNLPKNNDSGFKGLASPTVYKGVNPKPVMPGHKFVIDFLTGYKIGTGATQESTLISISTGKNRLIDNRKEIYHLTDVGLMQATISKGTKIANPGTTIELQSALENVESLHTPMMDMPEQLANIVNHDLPVMQKNVENLAKIPELSAANKKWVTDFQGKSRQHNTPGSPQFNEKVSGTWNGQTIHIKKRWGQHVFSTTELTQLFAGKVISFSTQKGTVAGKLAVQTYNGYKFVGFKPNF